MELTAEFTDYKHERVTGPRGGQKWVSIPYQVADTLHPVTVSFNGTTKTLYTRGKDAGKEWQSLYNADGTFARGIWQHGRYGSKMHSEGIDLRNGRLVSLSSYASGPKKDQHKYLQSI